MNASKAGALLKSRIKLLGTSCRPSRSGLWSEVAIAITDRFFQMPAFGIEDFVIPEFCRDYGIMQRIW